MLFTRLPVAVFTTPVATVVTAVTTVLAVGVTAPAAAGGAVLPAPAAGAEVRTAPKDGTWTVEGRGWGHGIGMSQYGANGAAKSGLTYEQILAHYYPGTRLQQRRPSSIRVALTTDSDGILEVRGAAGLSIAVPAGTVALPATVRGWRVRKSATGCLVERTAPSGWVRARGYGFKPVTGCGVAFTATGPVPVVLPSGEVRGYDGQVAAVASGSSVTTLNTLGLELYLRGVVPSESPAYFEAEALKAQSVAARTYAAQKMTGSGTYDLCDTTMCQVYQGAVTYTGGRPVSLQPAKTTAAIKATARRVLTHTSGGRTTLATTMFSASNGGFTVGVAGFPYLVAKADPYDAIGNPTHAWTGTLSTATLARQFGLARVLRVQILKRTGGGAFGGRITAALVEGTDAAGRYQAVRTTGSGIAAARTWPTYSDGLRGPMFNLVPEDETATAAAAPARRAGRALLEVGDRGRAVRAVQRRVHVAVDGWFGSRTHTGVVRFQRRHGLRGTGRVNLRTWRAMDLPERLLPR